MKALKQIAHHRLAITAVVFVSVFGVSYFTELSRGQMKEANFEIFAGSYETGPVKSLSSGIEIGDISGYVKQLAEPSNPAKVHWIEDFPGENSCRVFLRGRNSEDINSLHKYISRLVENRFGAFARKLEESSKLLADKKLDSDKTPSSQAFRKMMEMFSPGELKVPFHVQSEMSFLTPVPLAWGGPLVNAAIFALMFWFLLQLIVIFSRTAAR